MLMASNAIDVGDLATIAWHSLGLLWLGRCWHFTVSLVERQWYQEVQP